MLTIILVSILLLNKQRGGGITFSSFSLYPPFPLFLAQNRCFPRQCLLTKAVFFWWVKRYSEGNFPPSSTPKFLQVSQGSSCDSK